MSRTLLILVALLAPGCALLHPPEAPQIDSAQLPEMNAQVPEGLGQWWTQFNDPQLNGLIETALASNLDLKLAHARLEESRAYYRLARAARFPSLDLGLAANRTRASTIGPNPLPPGFNASTSQYRTTLDLSWELDVWGRLAAASRAAGEDLRASKADVAGAQASLAANVARSWFQLRAIDAAIALTEQILSGREQSLQLFEQRTRVGSSGKFELAQAQAERDTARASLPPLRQAKALAESSLAVLLGGTPKQVFAPAVERAAGDRLPENAPAIPEGLDTGILGRRPDIIAAEARLLSGEWNVRSARAAFFPRISLGGLLGYDAGALGDLFTAPARVGQVAAGAVQPLAGLASLGAARDAAAARLQQDELNYRKTILNAFRETHDALTTTRETGLLVDAQLQRVASLEETVRLAHLRYDAGYSDYLEVLDSERGRDAAASALIEAKRDRLLATVDLFLALGGGWTEADENRMPAR